MLTRKMLNQIKESIVNQFEINLNVEKLRQKGNYLIGCIGLFISYSYCLKQSVTCICKCIINNIEESEKKQMELKKARLIIRDMQQKKQKQIEELKRKSQKALMAVMFKMAKYARLEQEGNHYMDDDNMIVIIEDNCCYSVIIGSVGSN